MTPYQVFRICQGALGRRYNGTVEEFRQLDCAAYYFSLCEFLYDRFGSKEEAQRRYIRICEQQYSSRFDPFHLMTDEYIAVYDEWAAIHKDSASFRKHIKKSIQNLYDFCVDRHICYMEDYVNRWAVSHLTSGFLEPTIAYMIGVHESSFTRPEKRLIKKKFLDKIPEIESKLESDSELRHLIEKNIGVLKKKILDS